MLVIDPDRPEAELALGLFEEAESYMREQGARVFYAGPQNPELASFYCGVYGWSEGSGILESHAAFRRAATLAGYQPAATVIALEANPRRMRPARPEVGPDPPPGPGRDDRGCPARMAGGRPWPSATPRSPGSGSDLQGSTTASWPGPRPGTWPRSVGPTGALAPACIDLEVAEGERRKGLGAVPDLRSFPPRPGPVVRGRGRSDSRDEPARPRPLPRDRLRGRRDSSVLYRKPGP